MFREIWEERKNLDGLVFSELSGIWLGIKPHTYHFDHLLEKGNQMYEHLKYEKRNILLVTLDEHSNKGSDSEHPRYREFINKAKKELL